MREPEHLVAVLHSLPSGSGDRTKGRIDIARRVLSCATVSTVNLYPARLVDVNAMSDPVGAVWELGRSEIERELQRPESTDVLLGFGVQAPTGHARRSFRAQLNWLADLLESSGARVWAFGGRPTHPSRWQRVTHRHVHGGGVEALAPSLLTAYSLRTDRSWNLSVGSGAKGDEDLLL